MYRQNKYRPGRAIGDVMPLVYVSISDMEDSNKVSVFLGYGRFPDEPHHTAHMFMKSDDPRIQKISNVVYDWNSDSRVRVNIGGVVGWTAYRESYGGD